LGGRVGPERLTIQLLGTPRVAVGARPLALSPGASLLCAYLALAPREGRSRAIAASQLFDDCPESTARRRLSTALWRLRTEVRALAGVDIVEAHGNQSVGLSRDAALSVDTDEFEALVGPVVAQPASELSKADAERLARAVTLHRGQLVEPCHDAWVLTERQRIEDLYLTALDYLVQYYGARAEAGAAAKFGDLALGLEPLREDVHRHLMAAFATAERPDLVDAQFERCRRVLLDELGAEPMPETVALYARLTRGDRHAPSSADALVKDLEQARREISRLSSIVDRALERLGRMS